MTNTQDPTVANPPPAVEPPSGQEISGEERDHRGFVDHARTLAQRVIHLARRYPIPVLALVLLLVALVLFLLGHAALAQYALLAIVLIGGVPLAAQTLKQLWHRELGVDLIAILAITGSAILGQYLAGAFIVLMLSGGEALEAYALSRARSSLSALAQRAPRTAHVRHDHTLITLSADQVEVGMVVVVKPGELIPVDGVVVDGSSSVSEADLTGEPLPQRKAPGSLVFSGSVNLDAVLDIRATKRSAESQYAQIVRLVEEAQANKAPIHRLADRYAVWFTAITLTAAAMTWLLAGSPLFALAVLVVATPCPLILATPIAIMSGIDRAAKLGIILKSGATMEQLGEVDIAVFDKTGTLTLGMPELVEIVRDERLPESLAALSDDDVLALAASVEQFSAHVLARAVVTAAHARGVALAPVTQVQETTGHGLQAQVTSPPALRATPSPTGRGEQGREVDREVRYTVAIGNRKFLHALDITPPECLMHERERRTTEGQIASFIILNSVVFGLLVFADQPRAELPQLTAQLKAAGIQETALLTGDVEHVARQVAQLARIDRVIARCLPADKVRYIEEYEREGHRVLMIGDGVNDAPALATATVGLAVSGEALTASASAADAILLSSNLLRVATAVRLGRHVLAVAKQGIWFGMGVSLVLMFFAAKGNIPPAAGAILQEGVDVLVVLNALRAGHIGKVDAAGTASEGTKR